MQAQFIHFRHACTLVKASEPSRHNASTTAIVDPNCTIQENPSFPKSKSFELDDRCSGKGKAIAGSPEARHVKPTPIKTSQRLSGRSYQQLNDSQPQTTSRAKVHSQPQQRVFQPKYPSHGAQKRRQTKRVFVPAIKVMIQYPLEDPKIQVKFGIASKQFTSTRLLPNKANYGCQLTNHDPKISKRKQQGFKKRRHLQRCYNRILSLNVKLEQMWIPKNQIHNSASPLVLLTSQIPIIKAIEELCSIKRSTPISGLLSRLLQCVATK